MSWYGSWAARKGLLRRTLRFGTLVLVRWLCRHLWLTSMQQRLTV
uniref:Topless-related protein 4 n=1 Tax=Rhizophora mucronata TaxID=61149 RepID=A0A2P2Q7G6_RHIMU